MLTHCSVAYGKFRQDFKETIMKKVLILLFGDRWFFFPQMKKKLSALYHASSRLRIRMWKIAHFQGFRRFEWIPKIEMTWIWQNLQSKLGQLL